MSGTGDDPTGRVEWQRCRSLEDAVELAAQWFEGRIDFMPRRMPGSVEASGYGVRESLARISRLRLLVTDASEVPPQTGASGSRQFVTGFATEATAKKLVQLSCRT